MFLFQWHQLALSVNPKFSTVSSYPFECPLFPRIWLQNSVLFPRIWLQNSVLFPVIWLQNRVLSVTEWEWGESGLARAFGQAVCIHVLWRKAWRKRMGFFWVLYFQNLAYSNTAYPVFKGRDGFGEEQSMEGREKNGRLIEDDYWEITLRRLRNT